MSVARYLRAVEGLWARATERPVVLSPREYRLVSGWHDRGIPLAVVRECIDSAVEPRKGRAETAARSLTYLSPAVDETWNVILGGRLGPQAPVTRTDERPPERVWRDRLSAEPDGSALAEALADWLERLDQGEAGESLDREVDEALTRLAGVELTAQAATEVAMELEGFRQRMEPGTYDRTRRRAITQRLRLRLGLPRLARPSVC